MNKTINPAISQSQQKRLFIGTVIFFVTHSKQVYLHSDSPLKTQKVLKCENLLYEIKKLHDVPSFTEVKRTIKRMKHGLFDILPHEKNNSFKSSMEKYNDIMNFCQHETPVFIFS